MNYMPPSKQTTCVDSNEKDKNDRSIAFTELKSYPLAIQHLSSLAISRKLKDGLNLQVHFDQIIILQII